VLATYVHGVFDRLADSLAPISLGALFAPLGRSRCALREASSRGWPAAMTPCAR
jgi:hypothetical protein